MLKTLDFRVTVTDPHGAQASDSMVIHFINNEAPVINQFEAQPDNGQEPFTTNFVVDVVDADNDALTCTIDFGDGSTTSDSCSALSGALHTYTQVGTYNAYLSVEDGFNEEVLAFEQVFVFERQTGTPLINSFTLDSSNGNNVPTDLTLDWDVTHTENLANELFIKS